MKTKEYYCSKIGQYTVSVSLKDGICIVGNHCSNFGIIYDSGNQLIGMDWDYGLTPCVKAYIYDCVRKLKATKEARKNGQI